uniref:Uncharacterized protein n=1 Tax=Lepeophtheirus salmonis TaxID=72036 RepID=A0A0K2TSF0_LEPSM
MFSILKKTHNSINHSFIESVVTKYQMRRIQNDLFLRIELDPNSKKDQIILVCIKSTVLGRSRMFRPKSITNHHNHAVYILTMYFVYVK